jgi:acyl dehydratase
MSGAEPKILGQGYFWQDLSGGQKFKTYRRTVTEADLVGFINCTGMLEVIFIDADYSSEFGAVKGRIVPAALTYGLIEGMLFQTMMQGTGLAMLEVHKKAVAPVFVGDAIWATVEVIDVRPTSTLNRAILTSQVEVYNQKNETVISYRIVRLLAGRSVVQDQIPV